MAKTTFATRRLGYWERLINDQNPRPESWWRSEAYKARSTDIDLRLENTGSWSRCLRLRFLQKYQLTEDHVNISASGR